MRLVLACVLALMNSDEEDGFPVPAFVKRRLGGSSAASTFDRESHFHLEPNASTTSTSVSSGEQTAESLVRRLAERSQQGVEMRDGRGRYDRSTEKGKEGGYEQTAFEHWQEAEGFSLGRPCLSSCKFDRRCGMNITPAHLLAAHRYSYGSNTTKEVRDLRPPIYRCELSLSEVKDRRVKLVQTFFTTDVADTSRTVETFRVNGVGPVCAEYCRRAYGIPLGTWQKLLASARAGRLQAGLEWDMDSGEMLECDDDRPSGKLETVEWWKLWLQLEDQMPNEPVIQHRALVWKLVHEQEYSADLEMFGISRPLSRERWFTLRLVALSELSVEWYGADSAGQPTAVLSLRERARHSNFSSCVKCSSNRQRWIDVRSAKRGNTYHQEELDVRALKIELQAHIIDVKAQRSGMMRLAQECASRSGWRFQYDDACGSDFLYFPFSVREDAQEASRYKYRFAMQCNLWPGALLRCSLILPSVIKGGNFGCTAYFSSLVRLNELGRLGSDSVRQTDSGPDNDCKVTHAFHWCLIHFGVMQKLSWGRLLPKHSHNYADRVNSMVKEVISPQRGSGGGCAAPWDFEAVVKQALKTQSGTPEFAWHLNNTNWERFFDGCIHKDFADFSDHRFWVYEYDPSLPEHGYVRVTYKEAVNTVATPERPYEFKPVNLVDGEYTLDPKGLIFMQDARFTPNCSNPNARFPLLSNNPGIDDWKLGKPVEGVPTAKTWKQDRVFRDILEQ